MAFTPSTGKQNLKVCLEKRASMQQIPPAPTSNAADPKEPEGPPGLQAPIEGDQEPMDMLDECHKLTGDLLPRISACLNELTKKTTKGKIDEVGQGFTDCLATIDNKLGKVIEYLMHVISTSSNQKVMDFELKEQLALAKATEDDFKRELAKFYEKHLGSDEDPL
ncbi:unnamed protein product, partial [Mesorhabditis belari]|uniref:Uncharacterized protein n=1 Tax=Mesorhabditis belari TaxID=2138241 RepID=A0AAF3J707_9BILA